MFCLLYLDIGTCFYMFEQNIWNLSQYFKSNYSLHGNCEAMTSSTHSFAYIDIDCSKKGFVENAKMSYILSDLHQIFTVLFENFYSFYWGAMVRRLYWIEPLTLDQRVAGSFPGHQCLALLSFSKALYTHCSCSPPRCINGYPVGVGCEWYLVYVFACKATIGSSARNAPPGVEIVNCKCGLEIVSNDRGNTPVTLEAEWPRMPSEWKFFLHSWIFEVHSKYSHCILSAFQIFGPILVVGPNVFVMLKKFEVHYFEVVKYRTAFELHSYCIFLRAVTAFQQHSKHSDRLRRRIETARGQATSNPARMSRMRLEWAGMHLECISIAAGIYFDIKRIQLECQSNVVGIRLSIAARMRLEFRRNVPIGPRMSPDVIQNTAESHI